MSPEMAAALAAALPKYDPAAVHPGLAAPAPRTAPEGAPAIAAPKNGIVRLPDYVVRDAKIREFSERELYTPKGLQDLAVKRYISEFDLALNHFRIPLFSGYSTAPDLGSTPEKRAMAQYEDDEAKKRAQEMGELWSLENTQWGPIDTTGKK
jgi:hypothetical protein